MSLIDQSQQSFPTSVQVTVHQARYLRPKGKNGTNDAYAIIQVAKDKFSTAVVEKSTAPMWKEEASFGLPLFHQGNVDRCTLYIIVMHRVQAGLDKFLGQAVVNLLELYENKARQKPDWFPLVDKNGKADKLRGDVQLGITFMRNNMSASMVDLSVHDKSRSRMSKLKDKIRLKKKDSFSDSGSAMSQVLTDSEGDHDSLSPNRTPGEKKKSKLKNLFAPKSNLQRNTSQSMSTLGTLPGRNSSLSGSRSSGINVETPEVKKKFKFLGHKRSGSSDSKVSLGPLSLLSRSKHSNSDLNNPAVNSSHVQAEGTEPRSNSNLSLNSSGQGSMENVHHQTTSVSINKHVPLFRSETRDRLMMEQRRQEEEEGRQIEAMRLQEEEERQKKWLEEENSRKADEYETNRRFLEDEARREEEEERRRLEASENEERRRMEELTQRNEEQKSHEEASMSERLSSLFGIARKKEEKKEEAPQHLEEEMTTRTPYYDTTEQQDFKATDSFENNSLISTTQFNSNESAFDEQKSSLNPQTPSSMLFLNRTPRVSTVKPRLSLSLETEFPEHLQYEYSEPQTASVPVEQQWFSPGVLESTPSSVLYDHPDTFSNLHSSLAPLKFRESPTGSTSKSPPSSLCKSPPGSPLRSPPGSRLRSPLDSPCKSPPGSLFRSRPRSPVRESPGSLRKSPPGSPFRSPPGSPLRSPSGFHLRSPPGSPSKSPPGSPFRNQPGSPFGDSPGSPAKSPPGSPFRTSPSFPLKSPPGSLCRSPPGSPCKSLPGSPSESPPGSPTYSVDNVPSSPMMADKTGRSPLPPLYPIYESQTGGTREVQLSRHTNESQQAKKLSLPLPDYETLYPQKRHGVKGHTRWDHIIAEVNQRHMDSTPELTGPEMSVDGPADPGEAEPSFPEENISVGHFQTHHQESRHRSSKKVAAPPPPNQVLQVHNMSISDSGGLRESQNTGWSDESSYVTRSTSQMDWGSAASDDQTKPPQTSDMQVPTARPRQRSSMKEPTEQQNAGGTPAFTDMQESASIQKTPSFSTSEMAKTSRLVKESSTEADPYSSTDLFSKRIGVPEKPPRTSDDLYTRVVPREQKPENLGMTAGDLDQIFSEDKPGDPFSSLNGSETSKREDENSQISPVFQRKNSSRRTSSTPSRSNSMKAFKFQQDTPNEDETTISQQELSRQDDAIESITQRHPADGKAQVHLFDGEDSFGSDPFPVSSAMPFSEPLPVLMEEPSSQSEVLSARKKPKKALMPPSESKIVGPQISNGDDFASMLSRPHPVKPMHAIESQYLTSTSALKDLHVQNGTAGKVKSQVAGMADSGPFTQLTHEELITLVVRQQADLSKKDGKISELEEYIDNLLVRVIEEKPAILQAMNTSKPS